MTTFSLDMRPAGLLPHRKKSRILLAFIKEPFLIETQEGGMAINPKTVDDWDNGYFVAYPDDGSKPYAISPSFVRDNYAEAAQAMRAKFYVSTVTNHSGGYQDVTLRAVSDDGHPENNAFAKATPTGEITMGIDKPGAQDFFKPGQQCYLDFTEAPNGPRELESHMNQR